MKERRMPFQLILIITRNCNLNCVYCYEHNKDINKIDIELAKKIIKKYLTEGEYQEIEISLFGGEPFMEFGLIKELCEWTWTKKWRKKFIFFINTNGTLLTEEIKKWTTLNKEKIRLGLSLDGTRTTHNLNRSNSFDCIDLEFFLKNWPKQPVKMTISDKNLTNLANDIIFIHEKGFILKGCNFAAGIEINKFEDNLKIIAEQLKKLIHYYLDHPFIEIAPLLNIPLWLCEIPHNLPKKQCGIGENINVIDVDGKIYPCVYFSPLTLSKKQLATIITTNFANDSLFVDKNCYKNCYFFPVCFSCYGDNYTCTGYFYKRSIQKCKLTKLRAIAFSNYKAQLLMKNRDQKDISQEDILLINAIKKINTLTI